jgi:hypothetical protein
MKNNPKEFISFSHDNLVFENKILEFVNRLRSEGIYANVDLMGIPYDTNSQIIKGSCR